MVSIHEKLFRQPHFIKRKSASETSGSASRTGRDVGRVRQVRQVGQVRRVGQVGQMGQVRQVGLLGGLRRLGVRAKASECMELGMWGQICETGGTAGRIEKTGRVGKAGR